MKGLALEEELKKLVFAEDHTGFVYDLMQLYGISKATIARLKKGSLNLAKADNQVICKRKVLFEHVQDGTNLLARIDALAQEPAAITHKPRFIIVTDYNNLLAKDTKTRDTLDTPFNELWKHSEFFLPWAGKERYQAPVESMADVKAAEKMAKIYDEIYHHNKDFAENQNHALNVFLTRLLFCFFAEDTGIFPQQNQFSKALVEHTAEDGSDLQDFFELLFEAMDVKEQKDKAKYPSYIADFPYVNGSLFTDKFPLPKFTAKVRQLMIECGTQNWREINPDIFGSMFQAVKIAEVRAGLGQHYTSVPNIMKVINPLFMDELREEFEKAYDSVPRLKKLQKRLSMIRIFDPACGSGNFLIIAYKQLRLLELEIIKRIGAFEPKLPMSGVQLTQFYGIEIDDFACEIARLSLWLAEHQVNRKFFDELGSARPTLPLCETGHIVCGNALRMNWEEVCPKYLSQNNPSSVFDQALISSAPLHMEIPQEEAEVYILGNPPYEGARKQSPSQKQDLGIVFNNQEEYQDADYITGWFLKASEYINETNASFAFVSTQSITQGEQIGILWPKLFNNKQEIFFAHKAFRWSNNAKHNAGVVCVIIGLKHNTTSSKSLYSDGSCEQVKHISPYLTSQETVLVVNRKTPLSQLPKMVLGNMARDGGHLILSSVEKETLIRQYPNAKEFIKRLYGSKEFIRGEERWCLWIEPEDVNRALQIPEIKKRIQQVYNFRMASKAKTTNQYAKVSYRFAQCSSFQNNAIIVPSTSSERRKYIPMGFLNTEARITNSALAIYDAPLWVLGVLTSRIHMVWVTSVCGTLGTSTRYSAEICYNTFPFPNISDQQKKRIELCVKDILAVREKYSEKTMAELYDPDKMPADLLKAHESLDLVVESCYRRKPFETDEQRIKYLFKMYELMVNNASEADLKQLELF